MGDGNRKEQRSYNSKDEFGFHVLPPCGPAVRDFVGNYGTILDNSFDGINRYSSIKAGLLNIVQKLAAAFLCNFLLFALELRWPSQNLTLRVGTFLCLRQAT